MSETPDELQNAVKSDDQAQVPAGPPRSGDVTDVSQSLPQSAAPTLQTIESGKFPHEWWSDLRRELMFQRDSYARVCASYVLEENWAQATSCAQEVAKFKQQLEAHLQLFRDYQAREEGK